MPGWQVYYGSSNAPLNVVPHNGLNAGTINASILGPNFSSFPIIEGQYMPFLQSGVSGSLNPEGRTVSLSQVGLVPAMAQSLQFKVNGFAATNFGVFLNGQSLPLFSLFSSSSYTLWSAPVNGFTGQVSELRFTVFSPPERIYNNIGVDSFEFLSAAVPEPGTWALLGLGGALFCCAARRRLK